MMGITFYFGALLIILSGALFIIQLHHSEPVENASMIWTKILFHQPALASCRNGIYATIMRHQKVANSQYLQGFPAISRHYRAITSRHQIAPLQMKRALHMAACFTAYARLVFYLAIGWSSLPFSGWCDWPQNIEKPCCDHSVDQIRPEFKDQIVNKGNYSKKARNPYIFYKGFLRVQLL